MKKEKIEDLLEKIRDYVQNLNALEVGQETTYSDEEIFGRNINELSHKETENNEEQEELNEIVRIMIENAIEFVKQWYQEEFSEYREVTLEEILGSSKNAKDLEDYMYGNNQEYAIDVKNEEHILELEETVDAEVRQYYEIESQKDEIGDEKSLKDLSIKDLEKKLEKETKSNISKKQQLEKIRKEELIRNIVKAQQEGQELNARLMEAQKEHMEI